MKTIALLGAGLGGLFASAAAHADSEARAQNARGEVVFVEREIAGVQMAVDRAKRERATVEQRLANGELLFRMKDYARAIVVFSEILEEFPDTVPAYPDALWLRAETYYASREYLAARRDYRSLVDKNSDPRFQGFFGRALARLVDVSLRLNEPPETLKEVFDRLSQVPPSQLDAGLLYARGKAHYRRREWADAERAFQSVPADSAYAHQARYFQGLVYVKSASVETGTDAPPKTDYKRAIETFRLATGLSPDTPEHRHVIDLSWMAIGRLFYEMEQYQQASEAYAKIGRDSPEFDTMLYELAWVYVRLSDIQRAERALEVLAVSDPGSQFLADGTLLRADLLLRSGGFDKALELYEGIRNQYEPMRNKIDTFLTGNPDVATYYEKLSQQQLDALDQADALPPIAVRWAREAEDGPLAFAVVEDIAECRRLLRESTALVDKLFALSHAANRVRAFPDLAAGEETALGLLNRLARARLEVAQGFDEDASGDVSGELSDVRTRRRQLMSVVQGLPINSADFGERERHGQKQWNQVSQDLSRRSLEVDQLQANVNGLRRMLREDGQRGVVREPVAYQSLLADLDANERDLKKYRELIAETRRYVEMGRAQVGLGDARFQNDAAARAQFRELLDREVALYIEGQGGTGAQRFASRVVPTLREVGSLEDKLSAAFAALEVQVEKRAEELRGKIESERRNIERYQAQLDGYDGEARDLVGNVAKRNFGFVRDKLHGIVLRADVGITEQAWEVREEEMDRVRSLQSERARQEQLLDEELKEVRDDNLEPSGSRPESK